MIEVMIVEDQGMLRESLACAIDKQDDMHVAACLADAVDAPELAAKHGCDVVLLDVCTQNGSNGIAAAQRIKEANPAVRVVIMTGMPEVTFAQQAKEAGADSFVYKNIGIDELVAVMRSTVLGYQTYPKKEESILSGTGALTDVELEILRLVCEAKTRKEIASELFMSEGTVKRRIGEILAKTGYDNILRLAVHVVAEGSIVPGFGKK